jgi:formamidopyrimidine-DNA glycosylase
MPELPEVEVVRRGLSAHVRGRTVSDVVVHHPRAVRRHLPGADDLVHRLRGRVVTDVRRRGKYLWLDLAPSGFPPDRHRSTSEMSGSSLAGRAQSATTVADDALVMHLGMSGQLLVQPASAAPETHLRVVLSFADGDPQLRFVDQRTFGGLALEPLVAADSGHVPTGDGPGEPGDDVLETVPASVAHIARDPLDPRYDLARTAARLRAKHSEVKRALLDQTLVSGIGNIYADEALWRVGLHGERPTERLTRGQAIDLLTAAAEVMRESLGQGGTSFDALYVNVNGQGGYFERHLAAYGRAGEPCDRCGTPIVRQAFMNRSSYSCPHCQPPPRARRSVRGGTLPG